MIIKLENVNELSYLFLDQFLSQPDFKFPKALGDETDFILDAMNIFETRQLPFRTCMQIVLKKRLSWYALECDRGDA